MPCRKHTWQASVLYSIVEHWLPRNNSFPQEYILLHVYYMPLKIWKLLILVSDANRNQEVVADTNPTTLAKLNVRVGFWHDIGAKIPPWERVVGFGREISCDDEQREGVQDTAIPFACGWRLSNLQDYLFSYLNEQQHVLWHGRLINDSPANWISCRPKSKMKK